MNNYFSKQLSNFPAEDTKKTDTLSFLKAQRRWLCSEIVRSHIPAKPPDSLRTELTLLSKPVTHLQIARCHSSAGHLREMPA